MALKQRLDILLFEKGLAKSREYAKILIMEGSVYVDNQKSDKPGTAVSTDALIEVRSETKKYVSRGGYKLEKAMSLYPISLCDKICMDIGASTGGFTDCMLKNGAKKVYSIDVGYGQLAWELRNDERVVNLERTNVRYLDKTQVPEKIDFFSVDVSFISLTLVLPVASAFLKDDGEGVCLIKPQFEAGRENVGKNGVVKDIKVHRAVISKICEFVSQCGFCAKGLTYSPIKGPKGNIEYLLFVKKSEDECCVSEEDINRITEESHNNLNKQ